MIRRIFSPKSLAFSGVVSLPLRSLSNPASLGISYRHRDFYSLIVDLEQGEWVQCEKVGFVIYKGKTIFSTPPKSRWSRQCEALIPPIDRWWCEFRQSVHYRRR